MERINWKIYYRNWFWLFGISYFINIDDIIGEIRFFVWWHKMLKRKDFLRNILNPGQYWYICIYQYIVLTLTIKNIEKISKALGDNNRLKILMHISKKGGCGQCSEIQDVIDLAQPSVSHHIKILVEAGIIEPVKEGRNYKYNMNESVLTEYREFLDYLTK